MAKTKQQTFSVSLLIKVDISIDVKAENMEQALIEAKKLKTGDIIETENNWNDDTIKVIGVHDYSDLV